MQRFALFAGLIVAGLAHAAHAQTPKPLPVAVLDIRGFYSRLGQDPVTAEDLDVAPLALPARGLGGVAGLHVYVLRRQNMAVGVGAEGVIARGRAEQLDEEGVITGPPLEQRLMGFSGVLSLNFGHLDGWSYLSAGMGPLSFGTFAGATPPAERPPLQNTLNLGGGARWFPKRHLAFCFDVRFYQTQPEVKTDAYPSRQRTNLLVLSAGVAFK